MLLTTRARYAVMAIVDMAQNQGELPIKTSDIAFRQEISMSYLEQIFNRLKNAHIVSAVKGPGGGYILSDSSEKILISEIIKAVAEPIKFTRCQGDDACSGQKKHAKCHTHHLWKGLEKQVERYLENITVFDVCQGKICQNQAMITKRKSKGEHHE